MDIQKIVLKNKQIKDFAKERNKSLKEANSEWVLFVDSDEIISPELEEEIKNLMPEPEINGYCISRKGIVEDKILRLGRRDAGKWYRKVHEVWQIKGKTGFLKNPIVHLKEKSLFESIKKINFYSTLHAEANKLEGKKSTLLKIIFFPKVKFLQTFFIKKAYLKGIEGFVFSLIQALHSFLAWSKLWILQREKK